MTFMDKYTSIEKQALESNLHERQIPEKQVLFCKNETKGNYTTRCTRLEEECGRIGEPKSGRVELLKMKVQKEIFLSNHLSTLYENEKTYLSNKSAWRTTPRCIDATH